MNRLMPIGTEFTTILRADERHDTDPTTWVTTWQVVEYVDAIDEFRRPIRAERIIMVNRNHVSPSEVGLE